MFDASQEKKHGIFFKTAGEINDLYFFVRTENITSVQLTAFGNCSRTDFCRSGSMIFHHSICFFSAETMPP